MKSRISLTLHWEAEIRKKQIMYALDHGYGLEIVGISWPPLHNDANLFALWIKEYKDDLKEFPNPLSFHGPIADIIPHSEDDAIQEIATKRIRKSIETALLFGSSRIVFHSGISPVITDPRYYDRVSKVQGEFWNIILEEYPQMTVFIENMWDYDSKTLKNIKENCASERLRFCFDTGHFNVYAKQTMMHWFSDVGKLTMHYHLHDNPGDWDQHLPVGTGSFDWNGFIQELMKNENDLCFVIEVMTLDGQIKSIEKVKQYMN